MASLPPTLPAAGLLADAARRASAFMARARAANTTRAYRAGWGDFARWCRRAGRDPATADAVLVALYLAHAAKRLKVSTLALRRAAIGARLRALGRPLNLADPTLTAVWAGIRRTLGTRPRRVAALLPSDLRTIVAALPDTVRSDRDRALLLTGFAAALRRSELVGLDRADVVIGPQGMVILVRFSKTDRTGVGAIIAVPRARESELCAVAALERWLARRGDRAGPVFQPLSRSGKIRSQRLSDKAVVRAVKAAVQAAGLDPAAYAGHSLREGFAASADRANVPLHRIARQTRHGSLRRLRAYLRDADPRSDVFDPNAGI